MTGQIIIIEDGIQRDAFGLFGVTAGPGFADALCAPSSLKDFASNSSRLEDGKHVIVHNPKMDSREITLTFQIKGKNVQDFREKKANFAAKLQKGSFIIRVPSLGSEIYKLVYTKGVSYAQSITGTFCKMSCKFIEPNPADRTMQL